MVNIDFIKNKTRIANLAKGQTMVNHKALFEFAASNKLALFPILKGNKAPMGIVSSHVKDCSISPAQWQQWSANNPDCNFGVECGAPSGMIVIDVDQPVQEMWGHLQSWLSSHGENPEPEFIVQSPTGGLHCYYKAGAGMFSQSPLVSPGIDIRATGGYVVAPYSHTEMGSKGVKATGFYTIIRNGPIPQAPQALLTHCAKREGEGIAAKSDELAADGYPTDPSKRRIVQSAVNGAINAINKCASGERNNVLNEHAFDIAKLVRAGLIEETNARGMLADAGAGVGLAEFEITATLNSAFRAAATTAIAGTGSLRSAASAHVFGPPVGKPVYQAPPAPEYNFWSNGDKYLSPPEWLIYGIMPKQGVILLTAKSSSGKSAVATQLAMSVASGMRFIGNDIDNIGGVLTIAAEDERGVNFSIKGAKQHIYSNALRGIDRDGEKLAANAFPVGVVPPAVDTLPLLHHRMDRGILNGQTLPQDSSVKYVRGMIEAAMAHTLKEFQVPLRLLVIDTLIKFAMWGNENDSAQVGMLLRFVETLANDYGLAILLVDHMGASGNHARGSSVKEANVDAVYRIIVDKDDNDRVHHRRFHIGKIKGGDKAGQGADFDIAGKPVGMDNKNRTIKAPVAKFGNWGFPAKPAKTKAVEIPAGTKAPAVVNFKAPGAM